MTHRSLRCALGIVVVAGLATPAVAQTMGSSTFSRYNFAYRAVPKSSVTGEQAKVTIPLPLGVVQLLQDSTVWDTDEPYFNPVQVVNYILHPPIFLEIKHAPAPTNDVEFFIGKNELIVDLGESQNLIPDDFGLGVSVRPFTFGVDIGPVTVGLMSWFHNDVGVTLGDSLRDLLKEAVPAQPNTRYHATLDGLYQGGIAPQVGFARRVYGDSTNGVYVGAVVRYYVGLGFAQAAGEVGLTTGDTIFSSATPVTEDAAGHMYISDFSQAMGTGFGGDLGVVWVRGPLEVGLGVNDIGATITWSKTDADSLLWDGATDDLVDSTLGRDIEKTTQLPVSTLLHAVYGLNGGITVLRGGALINDRGAMLSASAEQRFTWFVLRGGLVRDQRKMLQFTWGGGVRFGPVGLDVNFFTHSRSISEERGITMATLLSIY